VKPYIKGRGSQLNPSNKFHRSSEEIYIEDLATDEEREALLTQNPKTKFIEVFPKTLVNEVPSPDIGLPLNINPYQGCEHGCIYCYARNTHEYWGYSAGTDFEQNILVKKSAPDLLRKELNKPNWEVRPILIAGNTDCYQPIERKLKITRALLEVFQEFKHPLGVITKNSMVERDIDILQQLASENLARVTMSLTTLDETLKRIMEPRTSSVRQVLRTIRALSDAGIPVNVNVSPLIPGINHHEVFDIVKAVADAGAISAGYIVVRLNGQTAAIFEDWLMKNFPERVNKVLHQIKDLHDGNLNDSKFGRRMKGEGKLAEIIAQQFTLARNKFMKGRTIPPYNNTLFVNDSKRQMKLF
jgi:DNA repair photolyase